MSQHLQDPSELCLDKGRWPGRAFLPNMSRGHVPLGPQHGGLTAAVTALWAQQLGVPAEDLVLCATATEAWHLGLGALLQPEDVCLVAEPAPIGALAAVLRSGSKYVDVGRLFDGRIDQGTLSLAQTLHPLAWLVACAPSLTGAMDTDNLIVSQLDRAIIDASFQPFWQPAAGPAPLLTLLALRDPDDPVFPLIYAWVARLGHGAMLRMLQGPVLLPPPLADRAWAVLTVIERDRDCATRVHDKLAKRYEKFAAILRPMTNVVLLPQAGWMASAYAIDGQALTVATRIEPQLAPVAAYGAQPLQHLVVVDLGACRERPAT